MRQYTLDHAIPKDARNYQLPMRQSTSISAPVADFGNYQLPMWQSTITILIVDYNFQLVKADWVILPFGVMRFLLI